MPGQMQAGPASRPGKVVIIVTVAVVVSLVIGLVIGYSIAPRSSSSTSKGSGGGGYEVTVTYTSSLKFVYNGTESGYFDVASHLYCSPDPTSTHFSGPPPAGPGGGPLVGCTIYVSDNGSSRPHTITLVTASQPFGPGPGTGGNFCGGGIPPVTIYPGSAQPCSFGTSAPAENGSFVLMVEVYSGS